MNGNLFIDLKAQSHISLVNLEHRNFEQALEAGGPSDDYRFPIFSRQDQQGRTPFPQNDVNWSPKQSLLSKQGWLFRAVSTEAGSSAAAPLKGVVRKV